MLHDAIEHHLWFHKEHLTSEEPFCFTKGYLCEKVSSDYKKVRKRCFLKNLWLNGSLWNQKGSFMASLEEPFKHLYFKSVYFIKYLMHNRSFIYTFNWNILSTHGPLFKAQYLCYSVHLSSGFSVSAPACWWAECTACWPVPVWAEWWPCSRFPCRTMMYREELGKLTPVCRAVTDVSW